MGKRPRIVSSRSVLAMLLPLVSALPMLLCPGPFGLPAPVPCVSGEEPGTPAVQEPETAPEEAGPWKPPSFTECSPERREMVETIRSQYGLEKPDVLAAMGAVPRHAFVPSAGCKKAYRDTPLPIGYGQTISQPFIVAEMTRLLKLQRGDRVLEVGTGSGYQAAVLTHFTDEVYTIEIIEALAGSARKRLEQLGYSVVRVKHGDGYYGWEAHAPYDAIIVTAAAGQIPPPLLRQLAPQGRMVIPVGGRFSVQSLMLVEKEGDGKIRSRSLMPVRFVPFLREDASSTR